MKTLDQKRATHAWDTVKKVSADSWEVFETQAKKLPTRIMTAGLGQALAFLEAKKYAPELREALAGWIHERRPVVKEKEEKRLVVRVILEDADFLRFATAECLAYLLWLVRFAEARGEEQEQAKQKKGHETRETRDETTGA